MLGKPKKPENETTFSVAQKEEEKKVPQPPKQAPAISEEKTTIGEHITIEGQIRGQEHLVIEGTLKGNVAMEKHNFKVGKNGRVDGEIRAQNVSISGQLQGKVNAIGRVEITKEADFFGDIKAASISVEDGAYFKGSIELNREPHRKTNFPAGIKDQPTPETRPAASSPAAGSRKEI